MIDAFDEIRSTEDRADALEIPTKRAHKIPDGFRIVVTSRFEWGIQKALRFPKSDGVDYLLMEDIPTGFTVRGVLAHVRDALRDVKDDE